MGKVTVHLCIRKQFDLFVCAAGGRLDFGGVFAQKLIVLVLTLQIEPTVKEVRGDIQIILVNPIIGIRYILHHVDLLITFQLLPRR